MIEVYIGLGSNLGDPENQLKNALRAIATLPDTWISKVSSFYRSKPVGPQNQPDFLNAVALINTELPAEKLLTELQKIEKQQDRKKTVHWGPRTIDLDILLYGNDMINETQLRVPHPLMHERAFVLYPLSEISPDLVIPKFGPVKGLLNDMNESILQKVVLDG